MEILRGETLSGYMVTVTEGEMCLNIYDSGATLTDGKSEIIVDELPEYDVKKISDAEAYQFFSFANTYFENLKAYMDSDKEL
jgi:hypothetical protein